MTFQRWPLLLLLAGCPGSTKDTNDDTAARVDPGGDTSRSTCAANNRDYGPIALDMIEHAERRVHLIEYVIYDSGPVQDLLNALVYAADRGVEVKVLSDEAASDTASALAFLSQYGIETRFDSPNTTTHNKLIIADDQTLVGSTNFSTSALSYNNESDLFIADAAVTAYYEEVFQALWADSDTSPDVSWSGGGPLWPLSNRQVAPKAQDCIDGASRWVDVVMYAMLYYTSYPDSNATLLVEALVDAHHRGVPVRVVIDGSDWTVDNHINDDAVDKLLAEGVDVQITASDVTTHAKLLICDDNALVSDANWSYSSLDLYNGTSVLIQDEALVAPFRDYMETLWGQSTPARR